MHYLWKLFEGAKNGKEESLPKGSDVRAEAAGFLVLYSCGVKQPAPRKTVFQSTTHERKGVCVWRGVFYLLGFCLFSCRVKTFKPVLSHLGFDTHLL